MRNRIFGGLLVGGALLVVVGLLVAPAMAAIGIVVLIGSGLVA